MDLIQKKEISKKQQNKLKGKILLRTVNVVKSQKKHLLINSNQSHFQEISL